MLTSLLAAAAALMTADEMRTLDAAIESCNRDAAFPVFSDELRRRSLTVTATFEEQERINAQRAALATRRQELDHASDSKLADKDSVLQSQRELGRATDLLENRQRALDDLRRLEGMRRDAIDLKRQYFLARCPSSKKAAER